MKMKDRDFHIENSLKTRLTQLDKLSRRGVSRRALAMQAKIDKQRFYRIANGQAEMYAHEYFKIKHLFDEMGIEWNIEEVIDNE